MWIGTVLSKLRIPHLALLVFLASVLVTLLSWIILPDSGSRFTQNNDVVNYYKPVALNIVTGQGLTLNGKPAIIQPPGYPLYLAMILKLSEVLNLSEEVVHAFFTLVLAGLTSIVIFLLASWAWGPYLALLSAFAWGTYLPYLWFLNGANTENLFIIFVYACFGLLWYGVSHQKRNAWIYLIVGMTGGAAMMIRPIAIAMGFPIALILLLFAKEIKMSLRIFFVVMIFLGNFLVIAPWPLWIYSQTGKRVILSDVGGASIFDGLTFAVYDKGYRPDLDVPEDVRDLMENIFELEEKEEAESYSKIVSVLAEEFAERPWAVIKLALLKVVRCWYGTDSHRFESQLMFFQIFYLLLILWATGRAWRGGKRHRDFALSVWLIILYYWAINFVSASLLRYMVPVMGFLFLLFPAVFYSTKRERLTE